MDQAHARIAVVGATGNVGTSVVDALENDPSVESVLAMARRNPSAIPNPRSKTRRQATDITTDDLTTALRGIDVVIHLAWLFQPTHDPLTTWRTNVLGGIRVFEAAAEAGVGSVVYSSSVGAYSPGPKDRAVDEQWPTHGWPGAAYTREKAYLERYLDFYEREHPNINVTRMRPGFLFKRESASEQRRLFIGPFLPNRAVRPDLLPIVPQLPGLRFQAMHTDDAAEAFRLAATKDVRGAFNLAAEPVVDAEVLAELFDARVVKLPSWPVRSALSVAWHAHLVPASPHLFDAVLRLPIMDTTRARSELGWVPRHDARQALNEFVAGLREAAGRDTPPLKPERPRGRREELRTGVGNRP